MDRCRHVTTSRSSAIGRLKVSGSVGGIGKPDQAHREHEKGSTRAVTRAMSIYWNYRIFRGNNTGFLFRGRRSGVPERISTVSENRRRAGSRTKEHATGQRAVAHSHRLWERRRERGWERERERERERGSECAWRVEEGKKQPKNACVWDTCNLPAI